MGIRAFVHVFVRSVRSLDLRRCIGILGSESQINSRSRRRLTCAEGVALAPQSATLDPSYSPLCRRSSRAWVVSKARGSGSLGVSTIRSTVYIMYSCHGTADVQASTPLPLAHVRTEARLRSGRALQSGTTWRTIRKLDQCAVGVRGASASARPLGNEDFQIHLNAACELLTHENEPQNRIHYPRLLDTPGRRRLWQRRHETAGAGRRRWGRCRQRRLPPDPMSSTGFRPGYVCLPPSRCGCGHGCLRAHSLSCARIRPRHVCVPRAGGCWRLTTWSRRHAATGFRE